MKLLIKAHLAMMFMVFWIGGMVLAKGFWSTLFTLVFFPWAFYLMIERIFQVIGFI
jgi:hypothetical protein